MAVHKRGNIRWYDFFPLQGLQKEGQKGCQYVSKLLKIRGSSGRTRTCNPSVNRRNKEGYLVDFAARLATVSY
jgi:hypothetical protein